MADDLVIRLRRAADPHTPERLESWPSLCLVAAVEIERLRAVLATHHTTPEARQ